ncbi:DUF5666 domain-containing protein [bacterium]|nr:DUF5666 domain-containing protein [bacterium]
MRNKIRNYDYVLLSFLVALFLIIPSITTAQIPRNLSPQDIIAAIKPGQWVEAKGRVQKDFSVICSDIEILTGDFLDDDWQLTGMVRNVKRAKKEFAMLRPLPIKLSKDIQYKTHVGKFDGFDDLKSGMLVEVEGTYLKDGTYLATEIENESHKLPDKPEKREEFEVTGKVGAVDVARQTITIVGIRFLLTPKTAGKSVIK